MIGDTFAGRNHALTAKTINELTEMSSAAVPAVFGESRRQRGTHPSIKTSISHFSDPTPTSQTKTRHGERRGGSGGV